MGDTIWIGLVAGLLYLMAAAALFEEGWAASGTVLACLVAATVRMDGGSGVQAGEARGTGF